ncbi:MAG TPA: methyltransferase domain-containing protein [Solirubrobacterales bacterium]|nr:methyltransferase domain-containing protein [Solirubrobacterales bacterium]
MSTEVEHPAHERLRSLLAPRFRDRNLNHAGYLDLLGDDLDSTGFAQNLMVTRLVPAIYERYWRPALGRVFKGVTGPGMAEEVRIARLLLGLGEGERVLDVACGPGNFSREFARAAGPQGLVAGIDASRTMLERGVEETRAAGLENLVLIRGDATALPFEDSSFDAACCFAALHLFADPFAALDEMTRVLAPGGRIAIMTSVRRQLTVRPLKPLVERSSGMRVFEADEITGALAGRGYTGIHQRLAGLIQFVGGRLPG